MCVRVFVLCRNLSNIFLVLPFTLSHGNVSWERRKTSDFTQPVTVASRDR